MAIEFMLHRLITLSDDEHQKSLEKSLRHISQNINNDRFMLMEYLGPVVDGCRAALNVSLEKARDLHKMSEDDFERHISSVPDSFRNITICMKTSDEDDEYSIVFDRGKTSIYDECIEPDVIVTSDTETLIAICDSDPEISPPEILGSKLKITGSNTLDVIEGLGFLCYPSLLRVAKSGVDPSSLLSEDADSLIMAAASDLVVKMIRKWIDISLEASDFE
jgi:putative sterol carrier protein